jgi:hypothetical protein
MPRLLPGGNLKLAEDLTVSRVGYGAMQLAGPGVWGPARGHHRRPRGHSQDSPQLGLPTEVRARLPPRALFDWS